MTPKSRLLISNFFACRGIYFDSINLPREDHDFLHKLLQKGFISEADLKKSLHRHLLNCGKRELSQVTHMYPDHLINQRCFGYLLASNELSASEKRRIRYDHGEVEADYIKMSHGLLEKIYKDLTENISRSESLTPQKITESFFDPHPSCC